MANKIKLGCTLNSNNRIMELMEEISEAIRQIEIDSIIERNKEVLNEKETKTKS